MGSSLAENSADGGEKGLQPNDFAVGDTSNADGENHHTERFLTRCGLTLESFQRRRDGQGSAELDRRMKPRHLNMIAIGGAIGAGFFVGSGGALYKGGPGFVLVDFIIVGLMIFNVVHALGELAVMYPVQGGFYAYSIRFIDPAWGFATGWNYIFSAIIVLPLELTVCALTIRYWNETISPGVWIAIFLILIIVVNILGTLGFAEEEFWSSVLKLGATVAFMIIAVVLVAGGGPENGRYHEYQGTKLWYEGDGPFRHGIKGFCSVFITASFSFSGTELIGLAAAEARNPTRSLPKAIKQVFWRITIFYILGLFFVGLLVSADDDRLLSETAYTNTKASPFVLAAEYSGLTGFNHFMNSIILVSVLSIGVASVYASSRTLTALAKEGYAPKCFTYIDRSGRPLISVIVPLIFSPLAFVNLTGEGPLIFYWLQAFSGLAVLFSWGSICLAHIRFRKAWAHSGHSLDEIPFKAAGGVYGSWFGVFVVFLVFAAQFYTGIVAPIGKSGMGTAKTFFKSYLGVFIIALFWVIGYLWKRTGWIKISQIDVDTGRREHDWEAINAYRAKVATWPAWRRALNAIM
ncbi:amino acid permease/ SLC12A domain-containing protein [Dactylonectria estremocensis]|uniref:Amino acid permease/ SLC12A domain-containing protein n=1 Tax=Dactylonectria estremocensis TaxID=1079267 RepID=A0A9P9IAM5_9HYPO|nr:amino acid permease/ SLC12A domain-containing protein [Dactylonectria estremocensis]